MLHTAMRLARLMEKVGFALWQLAETEDAAVLYFAIRLRPIQGVGEAAAAPTLEAAQRKSFGELVAALRKGEAVDASLADDLSRLVSERNWLVHRAKRENRGAINDPQAYARLVDRLDVLATDALALQKRLAQETESHVRSTGVSAQFIEQEAAKLRREWSYE